jgi:hypothetical protein
MIQERGKGGAEDAFMDRGEKKDKTPPDVLMGSLSSRAGLEPAPPGSDPSNFLYSNRDFGYPVPHAANGYVRGRSYRSTNAPIRMN